MSREEHPLPIGEKGLPSLFDYLFDSLRWAPFSLAYTYVLAKLLENGAKFIQKQTLGFKNRMRNLDNFRQAVESPNGYICPIIYSLYSKEYNSSAKTLYTKDLSNITLNYFCENSPNSLCHF